MLLDEAGREGLGRPGCAGLNSASRRSKTNRSREKPKPPFTTSTLQQEANRKLGFTARRTMQAAQSLYENGYITYMRTDSTTLAKWRSTRPANLVKSEYGERVPARSERTYTQGQERAGSSRSDSPRRRSIPELPESLEGPPELRRIPLFDLIWKRTIASQMADARKRRITITIEYDGIVFQASGNTIDFEGFLRAYVEGSDDPEAELANKETYAAIGRRRRGARAARRPDAKSTPRSRRPRYTEASLTRTLEEKGIGRPSTYASIIETIQARDYVFKKGNALVPSWTAFPWFACWKTTCRHWSTTNSRPKWKTTWTPSAAREAEHIKYLESFYFGDGKPGLKLRLADKEKEIDPRVMSRFEVGRPEGSEESIVLRVGKYGPFLEHGERKASLPDGMAPDELTLTRAVEMLEQASRDEEPLGYCPDTNKPVFLKQGRFGPYIQLGTTEGDEKPKNASLLKDMTPDEVNLDVALKLLSLPRTLGDHPQQSEPVVVYNGRYGPYVKCGSETRSLPADVSPLEVTMPQALELLAQPKTRGRGRAAAKEPIRSFDKSPVTGEPVLLLEGRYGPYVTDGTTNASIPKAASPDDVTLEQALQLLADRAAKSPPKKKSAKKKSAAKKAPAKKSAKKKTAKAESGESASAKKSTKKAAPKKAATKKAVKKS
jgi:DNA topoisomerase I